VEQPVSGDGWPKERRAEDPGDVRLRPPTQADRTMGKILVLAGISPDDPKLPPREKERAASIVPTIRYFTRRIAGATVLR